MRAVVWTQGCSLGCPGCFNPETHAFDHGQWIAVDALFDRIHALGDSIEGITISGGEPLQQAGATLALLRRVRSETSLSAIVFTGFRWPEVQQLPQGREILANLDILLAGRYDASERIGRG